MPTAPTSASRHQRRFGRLVAITLTATRRAWRRMERSARWEEQYTQQVGPQVAALVAASQIRATREADSYVADVLTELAIGPETTSGVLNPRSIAGVDGSGLPITTLLEQSVYEAGTRFNTLRREAEGTEPLLLAQQALDDTQDVLDGYVQTILADSLRAAEEAAMAQRPWLHGWVRMIEPGACSRCATLAGKFYLFNDGFERHPRCRCSHIPARENLAGDPLTDPQAYFDSLNRAEQDRIFTNAGAEAIRSGADISQVVNARRGMSKAQSGRLTRVEVNGQQVYTTTVGTGGRKRRRAVRLMPESILEIAGEDVAERIRLLRVHGFIT